MNTQTRELLRLDLDQVVVPPDRLRDVDMEKAQEMAVSMREHGQLEPVEVRQAEDGRYFLVFGAHRMAALRLADIGMVDAFLFVGDEDEARLREIDENLYRHDLNPLDEAIFLAERREIFERRNGKVTRGRKKEIAANLRQLSFFDDTTKAFGLSRDMIERSLKRYTRLEPDVLAALKGSRMARSGAELDALCKLKPQQQRSVVRHLQAHPGVKVAQAIKTVLGDDSAEADIDTQQYQKLLSAWRKAGAKARRQFIDHLVETGAVNG